MAFVLDDTRLRAVLAEQERRVERRRAHQWLEQLGRARQWLDDAGGARAAFLEAAELFAAQFGPDGRPDRGRRLETGNVLRLAGEAEEAERWLRLALDGADARDAAVALYLLGDDDGALQAAGRATERDRHLDAVAHLARARRDRDPAEARAARDAILPVLRSERLAPGETSGPTLMGWDIVADAFAIEAALAGDDVPAHREMLERCGLRPAEDRA